MPPKVWWKIFIWLDKDSGFHRVGFLNTKKHEMCRGVMIYFCLGVVCITHWGNIWVSPNLDPHPQWRVEHYTPWNSWIPLEMLTGAPKWIRTWKRIDRFLHRIFWYLFASFFGCEFSQQNMLIEDDEWLVSGILRGDMAILPAVITCLFEILTFWKSRCSDGCCALEIGRTSSLNKENYGYGPRTQFSSPKSEGKKVIFNNLLYLLELEKAWSRSGYW